MTGSSFAQPQEFVLEQVVLPVRPGSEPEFEAAFTKARPIISSMAGFIDLSLSRSLENPSHYLLLVRWQTLEDHTVGFRGSPEYQQWRELLHHFYDPVPEVGHFVEVFS